MAVTVVRVQYRRMGVSQGSAFQSFGAATLAAVLRETVRRPARAFARDGFSQCAISGEQIDAAQRRRLIQDFVIHEEHYIGPGRDARAPAAD